MAVTIATIERQVISVINYAHRGASAYFPENTMSAFYAGLAMGADGIETDIHRTKDGVLVLFHDDTLDRVTDGTGSICDYTYAQLQELRVRRGDRLDKIVSFEDFLRFFSWRELTFAIELKQDQVERETIDLLEKYHMREKTILTSFRFSSLQTARAYHPGYRIGYLYDSREPDPEGKLRSIGGEELCPKTALLTPDYVARYRAMGDSVRAWGVADEALMRHAIACGVDGMTVNFPDKLAEALGQPRA